MSKKSLYLVDGSTLIFRAYFAIRHLSNSKGLPTNAVYGFTSMLRKLIRDHAPDYLVVVFDKSAQTFRNELYPEYKAHRPPAPEDLVPQFGLVRDVTKALNIHSLEMEGFEADDIIATLAKAYEGTLKTVIVSSDKDLMQLVTEDTSMLDTMKNVHYGPGEVFDKMGVRPDAIIDYLALMGDKVDNIPGVPGIGKKSAAKLLNAYGSLEGVYNAIEAGDPGIKGKQLENLTNHRDDAFLSQTLATAKVDVPLSDKLEDFASRDPDRPTLAELFKRLEFKTWHREFTEPTQEDDSDGASNTPPAGTPLDRSRHVLVRQRAVLDQVVDVLVKAKRCALELHRDSTHPADSGLVGVALGSYDGDAWYVPCGHTTLDAVDQLGPSDVWAAIEPLLKNSEMHLNLPRSSTQLGVLSRHAWDRIAPAFDPVLASYVLHADKYEHSLENIALDLLGWPLREKSEVFGSGKNRRPLSVLDLEQAKDWACGRIAAAAVLQPLQELALKEDGLESLFRETELPLAGVLGSMEVEGVRVDVPQLKRLSEDFGLRAKKIELACHELAGETFSIGSPKQLSVVLFEKLELPPKKRTKTGYSTDSSVLEELSSQHPLPGQVLAWRSLTKLKSTYTDQLPGLVHADTGRIHTTYGQTVAATGRLSSLEPNLQNIPIRTEDGRRIRSAFIANEGCTLVSADYSQIELRILAHLCGSEPLKAAFRDGADIHRRTASEIFEVDEDDVTRDQRAMAKTVNFGILYGMSAWRLAREQNISRPAAKGIIERYFSRYPEIEAWKTETLETARQSGLVRTLYGRIRRLPNIHSKNHQLRAFTERAAINTPIQGTAADIIKMAMLKVQDSLGTNAKQSKMVLQVHDELLFEVPAQDVSAVSTMIVDEMQNVCELDVPLVVNCSSGATWLEAH